MNFTGGVGDKFRQRSESSRSIFSEIGGRCSSGNLGGMRHAAVGLGIKRGQIGVGQMGSDKEAWTRSPHEMRGEIPESDVEKWVPLSVREARRARAVRDHLWPYVWMNFVSMVLLFAAAAIMAYRMGAQSCH